MIQFGTPAGFPAPYMQAAAGSNQAAGGHQTQNPTSAVSAQSGASFGYSGGFAVAPFAMVPAFLMAYPQMMGVNPGSAASAGADQPVETHVTSNPTNAMADPANASQGFSNFGFGGGASVMYGMPVMVAPMFMQIGFPVFMYGAAAAEPPAAEKIVEAAPSEAPPVIEEAPEPVVTTAPPEVEVSTQGPVVDVVPVAAAEESESPPSLPALPTLPISEVTAADFAKYRLVETAKKSETNLELSLKTLDGDEINLSFNQLDIEEMSRFNGKTLEGKHIRDHDYHESSERLVNMDVTGELSAEEYEAVKAVLGTVIAAVQDFFSGATGAAVDKLKAMDFDTGSLAELSLNMSMSRSAEVTKGYHNGNDKLHDLKNRDSDVVAALEFMASETKRLVDVAHEVLDMPSAVKMIKTLLPPMMTEPFAALDEHVDSAKETAVESEVADEPVEEEG
ncbi:MAG: hypothetical protein GKR90_04105 [Pseudomonadales bacterium]|nr:hypothetical protein [Pseudomonadales bacterium]